MDPVTNKPHNPVIDEIQKWERVQKKVIIGAIVSLVLTIIFMIIFCNHIVYGPSIEWAKQHGTMMQVFFLRIDALCDFIWDHIFVWGIGIIFIAFFALAAFGLLIGVNLGIKG